MRPIRPRGIAAVAALLLAFPRVAPAASAGPAFDCAKAEGTVQKLICQDVGLAALDRKLDAAYKGAVAKAKGSTLGVLKAEQRGWIKGRDECWKATKATPTYVTESVVVDDPRACTEWSISLRIAELQVKYQLVPAQPLVRYACNGNPANEVVAQLFDTAPPAGRFERGDQTVVGYLVKTPDGPRYEGQNLRYAANGKDARIRWLAEDLACKVQ